MTNIHSNPQPTFIINTEQEFLKKKHINTYKVKNILNSVNTVSYEVLQFNKRYLCYNDILSRTYNNVIINPHTRKILSILTPKYTHLSHFKSKYTFDDSISVYKIEKGSHVQLFYEPRTFSWEIVCNLDIGGNIIYQYQGKCIKMYEIFIKTLGFNCKSINEIPILKTLPKQYTYHFLIQHPALSIINKTNAVRCTLLNVIETEFNNEKNHINILPLKDIQTIREIENTSSITFPDEINETFSSYEHCIKSTCSIYTDSNFVGIVLKNIHTNEATVSRNPNNLYKNYIQYTNPEKMFEMICTKKNKNRYANPYYRHYSFLMNITVNNIHQLYIDKYINKNTDYVIQKYDHHIRTVHHDIYLPSLQSTKIIIKRSTIREYIHNLHPKEIFDLLYKNIITIDHRRLSTNDSTL